MRRRSRVMALNSARFVLTKKGTTSADRLERHRSHEFPYIKEYIEERELKMYLLIDISPSNDFGSEGALKREILTEFAATIAWLGISRNDKVGSRCHRPCRKIDPPSKRQTSACPNHRGGPLPRASRQTHRHRPALAYIGRIAKRRGNRFSNLGFFSPRKTFREP